MDKGGRNQYAGTEVLAVKDDSISAPTGRLAREEREAACYRGYTIVSQCSEPPSLQYESKPSVPSVLNANIKTRAKTWRGVS